jgi:hypothetical protein
VGVLPASHGIALIGRSRHHGAVAPGLVIAPADRRARRAIVERLHLRRVGALAILLVEGGADPVADHAADRRAGDRAHHPAAAAPELRADHGAGHDAQEGTGALVRSGRLRIARTGGQ